MVKGIYDAARSMVMRQRNVEITANNLANINTTGFKRSIPFSEVMSRADGDKEIQITDFTEGEFSETGNPLDLAITERRFFMLETEKGIEITSNGKFELSDDGYLVNEEGYYVVTKRGRVNVLESVLEENRTLDINKNGEISVGGVVIDQLQIAKVDDQSRLVRSQNQRFYLPEGGYSVADESSFSIYQGYLEESNVNPIVEMQTLISINKDYESAHKLISSMDNIMGKARGIGRV